MKAKTIKTLQIFSIALSSAFLISSPAHAGFEWVPAPKTEKPAPAPEATPQVTPAPMTPQKPPPTAPEMTQNTVPVRMQPQPQMQVQPMQPAVPTYYPQPIAPPPPMQPQHTISTAPPPVYHQQPVIQQQPAPVYAPTAPPAGAPIALTPDPQPYPTQPTAVSQNPYPQVQEPVLKQRVMNQDKAVPPMQQAVPMQINPAPAITIQPQAVYTQQPYTPPPPVWGEPQPQPVQMQPAPVYAPAIPPAINPVPNHISYPQAIGFGNDIPLALALRQIVPAEYSFAFADNVSPGTRVSWTGGKAWNQVVGEMVAPLGFGAYVTGKTVYIK